MAKYLLIVQTVDRIRPHIIGSCEAKVPGLTQALLDPLSRSFSSFKILRNTILFVRSFLKDYARNVIPLLILLHWR